MSDVLIRDVDAELLEALKERSHRNERHLPGEVRVILRDAAALVPTDRAERARRIRERFAGQYFSNSVDLLREDRDR